MKSMNLLGAVFALAIIFFGMLLIPLKLSRSTSEKVEIPNELVIHRGMGPRPDSY